MVKMTYISKVNQRMEQRRKAREARQNKTPDEIDDGKNLKLRFFDGEIQREFKNRKK